MRNLRTTLILVLLTASSAIAQSDDWQVLTSLRTGTRIKVTLKARRTAAHCQFVDVTDTWLACYFAPAGIRKYARKDVREVSLGRHTARTGFIVGVGVGLVAGLSDGSAGNAGRPIKAALLAPLMGAFGAAVGAIVDLFVHNKPFYYITDVNPDRKTAKLDRLAPPPNDQNGQLDPLQRPPGSPMELLATISHLIGCNPMITMVTIPIRGSLMG